MGRKRFFVKVFILLNLIGTRQYSQAALGGTIESIKQDQARFEIKSKVVRQAQAYSVHEFVDTQTTIREFVSPSGTVFAVAWVGPAHPDLAVLLGSYHADFVTMAANKERTYGRRPRSLSNHDLLVQTGGAMFHLRGRAIARALVPSGVNFNEIK